MGGPQATEHDNRITEHDQPGPRLDEAWQAGKLRSDARKAQEQQEVAAAVAAELNLVLRGKPYSRSVLHYATGYYAECRDVLLAHEGKQDRRQAWQTWLEGYKDRPDFQTVWAVGKSITDARDAHRQAVREAAALKKAQQAQARLKAFFDKVPAATDEAGPILPKSDPQVFITTLKTYHAAGQSTEWVHFCPMTRAKSDPAGLAKLARRYSQQLLWEQTEGGRKLYQLTLSDEDWQRQTAAWRQQKRRTGQDVAWQAYHMEGQVTVIHDSQKTAGDPLDTDQTRLYSLVHSLLSDIPEGKKARTSDGFGGDYEGSRGDGRARRAKRQGQAGWWELIGQYVTEGPGLRQAAALLDVKLSPKLRGSVQMDHEDALLALLESGFAMTPRKKHKDALSVFDVILPQKDPPEGKMSRLTYIGEDPNTCTLSVTEDPIDEGWPYSQAGASVQIEQKQPQPIYLWGEGAIW
jgi:hypothetical protein